MTSRIALTAIEVRSVKARSVAEIALIDGAVHAIIALHVVRAPRRSRHVGTPRSHIEFCRCPVRTDASISKDDNAGVPLAGVRDIDCAVRLKRAARAQHGAKKY